MPFWMGDKCAQMPMESASTAIIASAAVVGADSVAAACQQNQNPDQGITAVIAASVIAATAVIQAKTVVAAA